MAESPAVLVLTDALSLGASVVEWVLQAFAEQAGSGRRVALVTQASEIGMKLNVLGSSVDVVVSLAETPGYHTTAWISELARILKPGGFLLVQEPMHTSPLSHEEEQNLGASLQTQATLEKKLLLTGFVGSETCEPLEDFSSIIPSSARFQFPPKVQPVMIKTQKLAWETGSSFAIKKKRASLNTNHSEPAVRLSAAEITDIDMSSVIARVNGDAWKVSSYNIDNDDLVDEDSLLTEEDLIKPVLQYDDCEVGKSGKKACKNCTCGRAELEEQEQQHKGSLTLEQLNNPQSSCGSCGLGDAFRCSTCPYRGLPTFKLGEKVSLTGAFLTVDT
ncbi:hypothetical protein O6H91_10G018200 [Diphasiastrum complanatum]|uniref:Uncharacterized protein n=1 Tax=Diphasiastrum complanatum TaxID=34168 RepID=A0ACC2CER9_DIPCM|nr:hypothetical protein O6H91_10G018200 [Diphasiastrum complanatum]